MIKYFKELDNRNNYYLPLVDTQDKGKKVLRDYKIPISFFEKYYNIFQISESLINVYKIFNIDKWFDENKYINYEKACSILDEYDSIDEDMYWTLKDYKSIDIKSHDIEFYISLIERLTFLFIDLFPNNKDYYKKLNSKLNQAKTELKEISTITYKANKIDNVYLPDSWFITPNGYLYNPGSDGHKGCDFTFCYNNIKKNNEINEGNSIAFINMARDIKEKGYITAGQFRVFLNYASQPAYLDSINGIPISREKNIIDTVIGVVMARAYFHKYFENMQKYCINFNEELNKLIEITNDDLVDILVRCCGFHKVESMLSKTITTSDINYKETFNEYIKRGWKIYFIPPIIIQRDIGQITEVNMESPFVKQYIKRKGV